MLVEKISLFPLKLAIYSFGEFLKVAVAGQWFIDSKGKAFSYTKTRMVPLVYEKIIGVYNLSAFEQLITTTSSPPAYKALYPPLPNEQYAVFLQISPKAKLLYGFAEQSLKNKTRKI